MADETIPAEYEAALFARIREQLSLQVAGDIDQLYAFTLPEIREKRIAEYSFEPAYSLSEIAKYVKQVETAELLSVTVDAYTTTGRYKRPCARVISTVRYNGNDSATGQA